MRRTIFLKAALVAAGICAAQPALAQGIGDDAENLLPRPDSDNRGSGAGTITREGVPLRRARSAEVSAMRPASDPTTWITNADYPAAARPEKASGDVSFRLEVDQAGMVSGCRVTSSSGSKALDKATCNLLRRRARFIPGMTTDDQPVGGVWEGALRWTYQGG